MWGNAFSQRDIFQTSDLKTTKGLGTKYKTFPAPLRGFPLHARSKSCAQQSFQSLVFCGCHSHHLFPHADTSLVLSRGGIKFLSLLHPDMWFPLFHTPLPMFQHLLELDKSTKVLVRESEKHDRPRVHHICVTCYRKQN